MINTMRPEHRTLLKTALISDRWEYYGKIDGFDAGYAAGYLNDTAAMLIAHTELCPCRSDAVSFSDRSKYRSGYFKGFASGCNLGIEDRLFEEKYHVYATPEAKAKHSN